MVILNLTDNRNTGDLHFRANCKIEVKDAKTGNLLYMERTKNLVVLAGRDLVVDLLDDKSAVNSLSHFAVGTGTTAVTANDTALETEVYRNSITQTIQSSSKLTVKYYLSSTEANGNTLAEAGIFNASSGGTMFTRVVFASTIAKTSSVTVTFTWDITLSAS